MRNIPHLLYFTAVYLRFRGALDIYFTDSGSTLQAAYQNNRKWIGVDNGIEAICTTLRRFHMGVEAIGDYVNPASEQIDDCMLLNPDYFTPTLFERCPIALEVQDNFLDVAKSIWKQEPTK